MARDDSTVHGNEQTKVLAMRQRMKGSQRLSRFSNLQPEAGDTLAWLRGIEDS
jgi:hypothetical protein